MPTAGGNLSTPRCNVPPACRTNPEPVMLGIGKLAAGAEDYYLNIAAGIEDYYLGVSAPDRWVAS